MTKPDDTGAAAALGRLLDAEREVLLSGDLEGLAALLTPKEELIDALNAQADPDAALIVEIGSKLRRNQLLLDGALEGIRAVSSRLAELRAVKATLETYGADGKKHDILAHPESSVERRA